MKIANQNREVKYKDYPRESFVCETKLGHQVLTVTEYGPPMVMLQEYWVRRAVAVDGSNPFHEPFEYFEVLGLVVTEIPGASVHKAKPVVIQEDGKEYIRAQGIDPEMRECLRKMLADQFGDAVAKTVLIH